MKATNSRSGRNLKLAVFIIILPLCLAALYLYGFAADRYVTSSMIVVRQSDGSNQQGIPGLATLLGASNSSSREDTLFLKEYVTSANMLLHIQKELPWRAHYAAQSKDPLYWFDENESQEKALKYFQRVVKTHFDPSNGLLLVEVEGFDPEFSRQVLSVILAQSERFVNEMSMNMAKEQVRFAESELGNARRRYEEQSEAVLKFQAANSVLDAQLVTEQRATVIGQLESQITQERAKLTALQGSLSPTSTQVRQQRNLIDSLVSQLASEKKQLVSAPSGSRLNVVASQYRSLQISAQLAEEAYKLSLAALDNARIEATKRIRSLIEVTSPISAEEAVYPKRFYNLLTVLLALLILYGLVRFVIVSVEDHRD